MAPLGIFSLLWFSHFPFYGFLLFHLFGFLFSSLQFSAFMLWMLAFLFRNIQPYLCLPDLICKNFACLNLFLFKQSCTSLLVQAWMSCNKICHFDFPWQPKWRTVGIQTSLRRTTAVCFLFCWTMLAFQIVTAHFCLRCKTVIWSKLLGWFVVSIFCFLTFLVLQVLTFPFLCFWVLHYHC